MLSFTQKMVSALSFQPCTKKNRLSKSIGMREKNREKSCALISHSKFMRRLYMMKRVRRANEYLVYFVTRKTVRMTSSIRFGSMIFAFVRFNNDCHSVRCWYLCRASASFRKEPILRRQTNRHEVNIYRSCVSFSIS